MSRKLLSPVLPKKTNQYRPRPFGQRIEFPPEFIKKLREEERREKNKASVR